MGRKRKVTKTYAPSMTLQEIEDIIRDRGDEIVAMHSIDGGSGYRSTVVKVRNSEGEYLNENGIYSSMGYSVVDSLGMSSKEDLKSGFTTILEAYVEQDKDDPEQFIEKWKSRYEKI